MPSSPTTRNRFEKMAAGERLNTWGEPGLNNDFDLVDIALDGWTHKALTGDAVLSSVNYSADEARPRCLKLTGTGAFTVTIPSVEKWYFIWNACTGPVTITTGAGDTAAIAAGEIAPVICDASNVKKVRVINYGTDTVSGGAPTAAAHFATKAYVDAQAFGAVNLPGQGVGTVNQALFSNGSVAGWRAVTKADVTDLTADLAALAAADAANMTTAKSLAIAFAVAL